MVRSDSTANIGHRIMMMLCVCVCALTMPAQAPTAAKNRTVQRVIITLRTVDSGVSITDLPRRARIADAQAVLMQRYPALDTPVTRRLLTMPLIITDATPAQIATLQSDPAVAAVRVSRLYRPALSESTTRIGARVATAAGYAGAGTSVAVLDTGVAKSHPFLAGSVVQEACFSTRSTTYGAMPLCPGATEQSTGADSALPCPDGLGGCDHGTHVAGIIAGRPTLVDGMMTSGVAPASKLIAIQVFSRFDHTDAAQACGRTATQDCVLSFESDVLAALDYLAAQRTTPAWGTLAAVNVSLGVEPSPTACDDDVIDGMGTYKAYVDALRSTGVATVISAGNDGTTNGVSHPACISTAVSVGATDTLRVGLEREDQVSAFSNAPSLSANQPTPADDRLLDLLAPGDSILSSMAYPSGSYQMLSGTSMAAPHVAGAWAVLKSIVPSASVSQLQTLLRDTGVLISDTRAGTGTPLIVPRITVDAAIAAVRAERIPVTISALGFEYAAVQRGTSAVQRLVLRYRGSAVRISRGVVPAPWTVTPIGCPTVIDDIQDACVLEIRYAPTETTPIGYDASALALTLNGVVTRIGLSAQTVATAPVRAQTQTAVVAPTAQALLTRTATPTASITPPSHAAAQTIVANATRTSRRRATQTAVTTATAYASGQTATAEATLGGASATATATLPDTATPTAAAITKTVGAARTATSRRAALLTQTAATARTQTIGRIATLTAQSGSATAEVEAGSPTQTRTPTATRILRTATASATKTHTRGPTLSPTIAPITAQSVLANGRYQAMIVRNAGSMGVLIHTGNRLTNDIPLITLVRLSDMQFGTAVGLDGLTVTALAADPFTTDRGYIAGRLDWQSGYLQSFRVIGGRIAILGTAVYPLGPGSDVRTIQVVGGRIWIGIATLQTPAVRFGGELLCYSTDLTPLCDAPVPIAGIPTSIIPIDDGVDRLVIAGRIDESVVDSGFAQVLLRTGSNWAVRPPIAATLPFSAGSATNLMADAERTVLVSLVDGNRIALYTLDADHSLIWRNRDVRVTASHIQSDSGRIVSLGYSVADRKNILTIYQPVGEALFPRRAAALTNTAGGVAALSVSTPWVYTLDALRLSRISWP